LGRARNNRARVPTIGVLAGGTPSSHGQLVAALVQRLQELGWTEGRSAAIEVRWAEGRVERFTEIATEFARVKVDVIVTSGLAVPAVRQAASLIPIVFAGASEPLAIGLVASLAQPGGNITGLSLQQTDYAGKRFELFREVVPELRRLAILGSVSAPGAMLEMNEVQAAARAGPRGPHRGNPPGRGYSARLQDVRGTRRRTLRLSRRARQHQQHQNQPPGRWRPAADHLHFP
jgi:putative tryptophan/tyrosine transport system substrate-binding protein